VIQKVGNQAVHNRRPIRQYDALQVVKELHHLCHWLVCTYTPAAGQENPVWSDDRVPPAPESGVPTDAYELEQAVADGFLVPPRVPGGTSRAGARSRRTPDRPFVVPGFERGPGGNRLSFPQASWGTAAGS
jgi:hypothetical protein